MLKFLNQVTNYGKESIQAARYIGQGLSVTFDHMKRRPITVQYPYEKLIPSERFRGRIHFEFDKCISCEVCVRVCPINLPVVDWEFNKEIKKKQLKHYSIDFGVCIFCANCVEYCPTNCLSVTEEYELSTFDRHELNFDSVAMGRLPYKVTQDPMVTPIREFAYLPKSELDGHNIDHTAPRAGQTPAEIVASTPAKPEAAKKSEKSETAKPETKEG